MEGGELTEQMQDPAEAKRKQKLERGRRVYMLKETLWITASLLVMIPLFLALMYCAIYSAVFFMPMLQPANMVSRIVTTSAIAILQFVATWGFITWIKKASDAIYQNTHGLKSAWFKVELTFLMSLLWATVVLPTLWLYPMIWK